MDNVEALDFNTESRMERLTRKLHISCLVQKIFSALQITRSRIKKEDIDKKASEKLLSFLIIGDHKKILSRAKTIFGTHH